MALSQRAAPVPGEATWPQRRVGELTKWATINSDQLQHNVRALVEHAQPAQVMAMVKANGYGHGAVLVARAAVAGGASWLGVSSPDEAMQLRDAGISTPVLIVGWTPPSAMQELIANDVDITVCTQEAVEAVAYAAQALQKPARVQVKLDTGMNRFGARPEQQPELLAALRAAGARIEIGGIFTHFANADGDTAEEQHPRFIEVLQPFAELSPAALIHCSNSAATLRLPEFAHDLVRPGIALYGYLPSHCDGIVDVAPAMELSARVIHIKTVPVGESVGYGFTWTTSKSTPVATVAAGYADGVSRSLSNQGHVVIKGVHCPIVGRVSMDQTTVDVSALSDVAVGDEAVFFGPGVDHDAADVAAEIGTISYEVICAVSARVPRVAIGQTATPGG